MDTQRLVNPLVQQPLVTAVLAAITWAFALGLQRVNAWYPDFVPTQIIFALPKVGISRAVRVGPIITVAGTAPLGPDGRTVGRGDAATQARRCLEIIAAALEGAGASMEQVVRTRILLTRIEDWQAVAAVQVNSFARFARSIRSCRSLVLLTPSGWWRSRLMQSSMQPATRSNHWPYYHPAPLVAVFTRIRNLCAAI
jgi:enamine deaminase RidA (YjgF/YER057c/UK114 family)